MTRGTIHLILTDKILYSDQFNGDMYLDGNGCKVITLLEGVTNGTEFQKEIEEFNSEEFKYDNLEFHAILFSQDKMTLKCGEEPGDPTFADYTYWKNLSGRNITFIDKEGKKLILEDKGIAVFCFCCRYAKLYPNND